MRVTPSLALTAEIVLLNCPGGKYRSLGFYKSLPALDDLFTLTNILLGVGLQTRRSIVLIPGLCEQDPGRSREVMTPEVLYTIAIGLLLLLIVLWVVLYE
jgi:hypothetical protein